MSINRRRGWKQSLRKMTGDRYGNPPDPDEAKLCLRVSPRGPRRRRIKPVTP
ncbi:hypothetical protein KC939_02335 [Candidatus Saccharibacteria bacterium]|nr:hypothetical protein [Candidatus Saccharibacteria bacterium]